jgi:hypothetical protein
VAASAGLGEADVEDEVTYAEIQEPAACQVNDPRQQDDRDNDYHDPKEEHHDAGDCVPGHGSCSHGAQLPQDDRLIRRSGTGSLRGTGSRLISHPSAVQWLIDDALSSPALPPPASVIISECARAIAACVSVAAPAGNGQDRCSHA